MIKGLYIHIPFCQNICHYCDFPKMVASPESQADYIDVLLEELKFHKSRLDNVKTIYIGGGTPSSLKDDYLERLLEGIGDAVNLEAIEEYTIEANPNDITRNKIELLKKNKINRVSLGVQSFDQKMLKVIGRTHCSDDVHRALGLIRSVGGFAINLDLMYGLPNQTLEIVRNDLEAAIKAKPEHISYYELILEERTRFHYLFKQGLLDLPEEDLVIQMSETIHKELKRAGYRRYEISNYAKDGYASKHNLGYWLLEEYLGIGMGAASQYDNSRFVNPLTLKAYLEAIKNRNLDKINQEPFQPELETVMLGLRLVEGISLSEFQKRFDKAVLEVFPTLRRHIDEGLLVETKDRLFLNERGLDLANRVMSSLF